MTGRYLTPEDVADELQMPVAQVKRLTHTKQWPCIRISKNVTRYTTEHLEQIVAMYTRDAAPTGPVGLPGQTARSRRRSAS